MFRLEKKFVPETEFHMHSSWRLYQW